MVFGMGVMTRYENIPYRIWRRYAKNGPVQLVATKAYERVMNRMGDAMAQGKSVNMTHQIVNPEPAIDQPYDTITVIIE